MIFYRDLDMLHEKEKIIESEKFKSLFPDYDRIKHISENKIPDYESLRKLIQEKLYGSDNYIRENVNADYYIRWKLLVLQEEKIKAISSDIANKKIEEIYTYYADYNYIDLKTTEMWTYLTKAEENPTFLGFQRPHWVLILRDRLFSTLNALKNYINSILGYNEYEEFYILKDIITNDEIFHNIRMHNSNDGQPLPWPLFNTAEGQQYLANKLKEIRIPKIISKAKELYNKPNAEIEPIKYHLHYLKQEPVFKKLSENRFSSPNYVKLLSERIEKFEREQNEDDYKIDCILRIFHNNNNRNSH